MLPWVGHCKFYISECHFTIIRNFSACLPKRPREGRGLPCSSELITWGMLCDCSFFCLACPSVTNVKAGYKKNPKIKSQKCFLAPAYAPLLARGQRKTFHYI